MLGFIALLERMAALFDPALARHLRRWATARRTESSLRAVDPATLSDIGLNRGEIAAKAWEVAWRQVPAEAGKAPSRVRGRQTANPA